MRTTRVLSTVRRGMYRTASVLGDVQAAAGGPVPLARHFARKGAHRELARLLRKAGI